MHIRAYAKINPFLDITGRRDNGYHDLSIVFRPVSIYDELEIDIKDCCGASKVFLKSNKPEFAGEDNIVHKAYAEIDKRFLEKVGERLPSFEVNLIKNIPSGAGMAGGSTDASAFLYAVNLLCGNPFSMEELLEMGANIGADVPACLLRNPSVATGIGDKLEVIESDAKAYYVVIKPDVSFNTGEMYRKYDELLASGELSKKQKDVNKIVNAIKKGKIKSEAKNLYNVFEKVIPEKKLLKKIKKDLVEAGAMGALLTGSGSCVYGVFDNKKERDKAFKKLKKVYDEIYSCESVNEEKRERHFVYIFECEDKTLYTGWTTDLNKREKAHNGKKSGAKYTKSHGGGKIVYFEEFDNKSDALKRERKIKDFSRKKKLEIIGIRG